MNIKKYSHCKQQLSINSFYSNRKTSDGLDNLCNKCRGVQTSKQYAKTKSNPDINFELRQRNKIAQVKYYQRKKQLNS